MMLKHGSPFVANYPAWLCAGFILLWSFVAVSVIRIRFEGGWYPLRWSTWWFGDLVAIPVFVYFASRSLKGYKPEAFFDRWIFTGIFMLVGLGLAMTMWMGGMKTRGTTWADFRVPSELWHTFIVWPVFVAIVAHALLSLIFNRPNPWSNNDWGWLLGCGLFALALVYDSFVVNGNAPGR